MKKIISIAISTAMMLSMLGYMPAQAAEISSVQNMQISDVKTTSDIASGTCGENLTWTLDNTGTLTISGEGEMEDWNTESDVVWYEYVDKIKKVYIYEGVSNIGAFAFNECASLTEITIPESVKSIEEYAFTGCSYLTGISLPDSITYIGDRAFMSCSRLTSIQIPSNTTSIGREAFRGCDVLSYIYIYNPNCEINCEISNGLYTIPSTATIYGYSYYFESATTRSTAQNYASKLGRTFKSIGTFGECSENLTWTNSNGFVTLIGTGEFTEPMSSFISNYSTAVREVTICEGITALGEGVFPTNMSLESVILPSTLTEIGNYAFAGCSYLTSIELPNSLNNIGDYAFAACNMLSSVTIPESVTNIGSDAFYGCGGLTSVTIKNPTCTINDSENTIPSTATIYGIQNSTAQKYAETNDRTFEVIPVVANGTCGENLTWVLDGEGKLTISGEGAMTDWSDYSDVPWYDIKSSITSVIIEDGVTSIGEEAFHGCVSMASVTIPDSVTSIGYESFCSCRGLTSITIPDSVTYIEEYAFCDCQGLTSITLPSNISIIWEGTFTGCTSLISIIIPESVTNIDVLAFENCSALTSVTIPDSVTNIGNEAFFSCDTLTSITIENPECEIYDSAYTISDTATIYGYEGSTAQTYAETYGRTFEILTPETPSAGENELTLICQKDTVAIPNMNWNVYLIGSTDENGTIVLEGDFVDYPVSFDDMSAAALQDAASQLESYALIDEITPLVSGTTDENGAVLFDGLVAGVYLLCSDSVEAEGVKYYSNAILAKMAETDGVVEGIIAYPIILSEDTYVASGTCGDDLTWTLDNLGTLTISGTGEMYDFESTSPWSEYNTSINEVVIEDGATYIGNYAFPGCTNLSSVYIADSVTSMGDNVFTSCQNLTSVTLSENLANIGIGAFLSCKSLESIVLPDSITNIGMQAFLGCSSLKNITIPDSVTSVGVAAFNGCTNLNSVNLSSDLEEVSDSMFLGCSSLISITIPDSVTSISGNAFFGCTGLTDITLPESVANIGIAAFSGCSNMTSIRIENPECVIYDSSTTLPDVAIYGYSGSTAQTFAETYDRTFVAIDIIASGTCGENLTWTLDNAGLLTISGEGEMEDWSWSSTAPWDNYRDTIKSVVIENGVTSIGDYAFHNCGNMTSITIADSVTSIGYYAFASCESLAIDTIGNSVTRIGDYAFAFCYSLAIDTIGNNITSIGDYAFEFCDSLTSITISDKVESIGNNAFYNCLSLTKVKIGNSVTSIGSDAFASCRALSTVMIGNGVTNIGNYAFYYCDALTTVTIGTSVTSIGGWAFDHCSALTAIAIPDSVTSIGVAAFQNCDALSSITIENPDCEIYDSTSTISDTATIYGYINSTAHTYAKTYNRTFIPLDAIAYGTYSDTLSWMLRDDGTLIISGTGDMPDWDLTTTAPWSEYLDQINFVVIEDGITSIGDRAFENYTYLKKVKIADTVTRIGSKAFYGCGMLEILRLPESVAAIDSMALNVIADGAHIYIYNPDCEIYASEYTIGTNTIIHGTAASSAYYHANSYDIKFVELEELPVTGVYDVLTYEQYSDHIEIIDCDSGASYVDIPAEIDGLPVTVISHAAFAWCENLLNISIPDGVVSIGDASFRNAGLINISLPFVSLTSIGNSAFAGTNLESIIIPDSVLRIGQKAFYRCANLSSIQLSENLFKLEDNTFYGCTGLDSITIPRKVMFMPSNMFGECTELGTVKIMNPDCMIYTNDFAVSPVVYGYDGSTAETFAGDYGYLFIPFESESVFETGIITLDNYYHPRGFFGRTLALFSALASVDESETPMRFDRSYLYGTNVFDKSIEVASELTLELGENDKFIVFGDMYCRNLAPVIINKLENPPENYKFSEKPMIFSSGAITCESRFETDTDVNIYCGSFNGPRDILNVNGNIYCYDAFSESVLQHYSPANIYGNFYTAGNLAISVPSPSIKTIIDGDLVVEGDLTLTGSLQVNGNIYVGGTLTVVPDSSIPCSIYCDALYANMYEGDADLTGVGEIYLNDMFVDYASEFVFDPETSDQLLARDLSIDIVSGLYYNNNPFFDWYEEYYGCDCNCNFNDSYSVIQPPMIPELSKVNYKKKLESELYDPIILDSLYLDYMYWEAYSNLYTDAVIPTEITSNAIIQGPIHSKEIYIDPMYSDIYIFMEDVTLQDSIFIVNNDAPYNCYFIVDGDMRFDYQSSIVTSQYYDQLCNGTYVEVLSEEDNVNVYLYMRNEEYYGITTEKTTLSLHNSSYITGHIWAPYSIVNIEGVFNAEFYYDNVYSADTGVYPRVAIIGSVVAGELDNMNDSAILYVSDKRDMYIPPSIPVTPEFTEEEILDAPVQPKLSAPIITLTESEARSGELVPVRITLNDSDDSWNNIKFHLNYDNRLAVEMNKDYPKYLTGNAAAKLYMKSAGYSDDVDFPSVFFAASGNENVNQGTDGEVVTFYFMLPSDAAAGDIFDLDLELLSDSDVFTNYENDITGQLMQAYLINYGITDGYIQIVEDEITEVTTTTALTTTVNTTTTSTVTTAVSTASTDDSAEATSVVAETVTTEAQMAVTLDFGAYEAYPGETVTVCVIVNSENQPIAGFDATLNINSPLVLSEIDNSSPAMGGEYISGNVTLNKISGSFIDENGNAIVSEDGKALFSYTVTIPDDCPAGEYTLGCSDISVYKDSDETSFDSVHCNIGCITVREKPTADSEATTTTDNGEVTETTTTAKTTTAATEVTETTTTAKTTTSATEVTEITTTAKTTTSATEVTETTTTAITTTSATEVTEITTTAKTTTAATEVTETTTTAKTTTAATEVTETTTTAKTTTAATKVTETATTAKTPSTELIVTQQTTVTTQVQTTDAYEYGNIVWKGEEIDATVANDEATEVTLNFTVDNINENGLPVAGAEFGIEVDSALAITEINGSDAYNADVLTNSELGKYYFSSADGSAIIAENGKTVVSVTVSIPAGCNEGSYTVRITDLNAYDEALNSINSYITLTDGVINVSNTNEETTAAVSGTTVDDTSEKTEMTVTETAITTTTAVKVTTTDSSAVHTTNEAVGTTTILITASTTSVTTTVTTVASDIYTTSEKVTVTTESEEQKTTAAATSEATTTTCIATESTSSAVTTSKINATAVSTTDITQITVVITTTTNKMASTTIITTTTKITTTTANTTKETTTTSSYEKIVWAGENANATAGDTLSVDITVEGDSYLPVAGVEFAVSVQSPLKLIGVNGSAAYNSYISENSELNVYSFTTSSGDGISASDGAVVMSLMFEIPESCPSGDYEYYLSSISAYDKNGDDISEYITLSSGTVTVKALTTVTSTTMVKSTAVTTTTTTKATTANPTTTTTTIYSTATVTSKSGTTTTTSKTTTTTTNVTITSTAKPTATTTISITTMTTSKSDTTTKITTTSKTTTTTTNVTTTSTAKPTTTTTISITTMTTSKSDTTTKITTTSKTTTTTTNITTISTAKPTTTTTISITTTTSSKSDTTTTTATTSKTTTTTTITTQSYEKIVWAEENADATAGDTLSVDIKVEGEYYLPVAGLEFAVSVQSPLKLIGVSGSEAYNSYISKNSELNVYSFTTSSGDGISASDGAVVMSLMFEIPESCPSGDYEYYLSSISAYDKNGDDISEYITLSSGTVTVTALTTAKATTTSTTSAITTSTTTTSTTTTTTSTTTTSTTTTSTTTTSKTTTTTTEPGIIKKKIEMQIGETIQLADVPKNITYYADELTGSKRRPLFETGDGTITALNSGTKSFKNDDETVEYIITVLEPTLETIGNNVFTSNDDKIVFEVGNLSEEAFAKWSVLLRDDNNRNQHTLNNSTNTYFSIEKNGLTVTVSLKADVDVHEVPINQYKLILVSPSASNTINYEYDLRFTVSPLYLLGDVDFDGAVNAVDASMVLAEYALQATGGASTFTDMKKKVADVNIDGFADASDASSILGYYAYISTGGKGTIEEYLN